ncbi:E3 SUMO-protein ligase PIAS2 [Ixodes scapularis]|nr:E3 SUMO-protein ligase PIAS2 [Ixodes scapularis]
MLSANKGGAQTQSAQFLLPFYRILSTRKVWWGLGFFSVRLLPQDLAGDIDRRRVLLHFVSSAKPVATCKVTLAVNDVQFADVPLKVVNVSGHVKAGINSISISGSGIPRDLCVGVLVVDRTEDLKLVAPLADDGQGIHDVSAAKALSALMDDKENRDAIVDCATVSLNCPLKRARLVVPCRGADCRHVQCFDALAYLRLNEATVRPLWRCPVCDKDVDVRALRLDLFTLEVLRQVAESCDAVKLFGGGLWTAVDKRADVICIEDSPARPLRLVNRELEVSFIDLTASFTEDA